MATTCSALRITKRFYSAVTNKVRARKYVLTSYFQGEPKKSDFRIVEEELPDLKNGGKYLVILNLNNCFEVGTKGKNPILVHLRQFHCQTYFCKILTEAEYISVDPYMRAYMIGYKLPTDMIGGQVAKIIASRNDKFPVGKYVAGYFGWRTHTVCDPSKVGTDPALTVFPDVNPHPVSLALGILGMPGNTAYFGLKEVCKPKKGETIVITGAAGAVGSHVGQIAKIMGCRVVGFAGSHEKCNYLEKELGFDRAFNYKTADIRAALREGAPNRVDCYFDNVGGEISSTIMSYMNKYGRVAVCGSISSYNDAVLPKVTLLQPSIVFKELKVEGFLVNRWYGRWNEGIEINLKWLREGKLKYNEKIYHGFENMVDALVGILRGENTGKAVVKVK